ncbi:DNA repair protein rad10 [Trametopsis cervina]|nr:DNA repair protein rad10 [Trametopsis cervina]
MQTSASTSTSTLDKPPAIRPNTKAPAKPPVVLPGTGNNIIVNSCQRGNPVLECIRNIGKEFGDIVADYQVGRTTGILYLSLRYHRLHPEYIHQRIERLGTSYNLRVLLILCDVSEHQDSIRELTKVCLINNITVMVAWTAEEAGFYISTYKQFEHKPPDLIKERVDKDYSSMMRTALTSISKVNKTDVEILKTSVGSFADISKVTTEQLLKLPGFGQVKVRRLKDAFDKPFRNTATSVILPHSQRPSQLDEQPLGNLSPAGANKGKDKERAPATSSDTTVTSTSAQRIREPSPVWDIELDLNDSPTPDPGTAPLTPLPQPSRKRLQSPVWDIELDLNDSDMEDVSRKRRKGNDIGEDHGFGIPDML